MRVVILIVIMTVAVVVGMSMLLLSGGQTTPAPAPQTINTPPSAAQVATVDVFVAREDIPVGTMLTEQLIDRQPWPSNLVLEGFITASSPDASVVGMVARGDFKSREPLIASKLSTKDSASVLASTLGKGMRAVTLAVDPVSGVAGFILPGDRVDVVLTHAIGQRGAEGNSAAAAAEVVLPDVRVLAVNNRKTTQPSGNTSLNAGAVPMMDEVASNITLEISQQDAKRLRLAEKNGTLSLALRSLEDRGEQEAGAPVSLSDITQVKPQKQATAPANVEQAAPERVNILRGGIYGGTR